MDRCPLCKADLSFDLKEHSCCHVYDRSIVTFEPLKVGEGKQCLFCRKRFSSSNIDCAEYCPFCNALII